MVIGIIRTAGHRKYSVICVSVCIRFRIAEVRPCRIANFITSGIGHFKDCYIKAVFVRLHG